MSPSDQRSNSARAYHPGYRTVKDVGDSAYGVFASPATFTAFLFSALGRDAG